MSISAPPYMPMAWASGTGANVGAVNSAIWTTFTTNAPTYASLNDGFPTQQMAPGGVPPQGGDMNAILSWITMFQTWVNAGGRFQFNSTLCTAIGGYPSGMVLQLTGGQGEVVSIANNNSNNPNSYSASQLAVGAGGWIIYAGNATVNATAGTIAVRDANGYLNAVRFVGSGAGLSSATVPTSALAAGALPANVSLGNASVVNASVPSSLTVVFGAYKMMGWGASPSFVSITPHKSGTVLVIVTGIVWTSASTAQGGAYLYYGTGTAPSNNANLVGTAAPGNFPGWGSGTWSASQTPWTGVALLGGLTPGTTYWLDVAVSCSGSSGNASMSGSSFTVIEI